MTKIVGYRFGKAPTSGFSFNYAENEDECGVSMAAAAGLPESNLMATLEAKAERAKYFYTGTYAGTGGDDEICLINVAEITEKEYLARVNDMNNKNLFNKIAEKTNSFYGKRKADLEKRLREDENEELWIYHAKHSSNPTNDKKMIEYYESKLINC